jgi:predicted NBD/HSP70 family sugar kinase
MIGASERCVAGIDIGATKWLLASGPGSLFVRYGLVGDDPQRMLAGVLSCLQETSTLPAAVVCSFAGVLDTNGTVVAWPNRPSWTGFQLRDALSGLASRVQFEDDGVCAAVGERSHGCAQGLDDFLCVTIGTGIGSGLFLDGRIRRSAAGQPGGLGHFRTGMESRCSCGASGCLQSLLARGSEAEPLDTVGRRRLSEIILDLVMMLDLRAVVLTGGRLGRAPAFAGRLIEDLARAGSGRCRLLVSREPAYSALIGAYLLAAEAGRP